VAESGTTKCALRSDLAPSSQLPHRASSGHNSRVPDGTTSGESCRSRSAPPGLGSRLFGNCYRSGIVLDVMAQLIGEFPRHDDPGEITETEGKTLGNPPFAFHAKIVGISFGKPTVKNLS